MIDWTDRKQIEEAVRKYNKIPINNPKNRGGYYINNEEEEKIKKEKERIEEERIRLKRQNKEKEIARRKRLEIFRGEYMDYCCPSCDGKLKIVYTKWSTTHFAKSICEDCDKFDRWIPHPKPDNEFK